MCPVYFGLPSSAYTAEVVHPPGLGDGQRPGSALKRLVMVVTPSRFSVRQVKICATTGARTGSRTRRVLVRPWAALPGLGCGIRSGAYP
jgi:hypothetical protein